MTNIRARQPYARRPAPQNDLKPFLDTEFANIQRGIPVPVVRAVFADDTVQASDDTIEVDATAGAVTVTLPPPDRFQFLRVTVIRVDDSASAVIVSGDMGETTAVALNAPDDSITLQSDGSTWLVLQSPVYATFDVRRYGAIGDGVHDDTAAIQAAFDAAGVVGGLVLFPFGTYLVTQLVPPSNIVIDLNGATLKPIGSTVDVLLKQAQAITVSTTITAGATLASAVVTVSSVAGFAVGDVTIITTDYAVTMPRSWSRIQSINSGTKQITLDSPLQFTYAGNLTLNKMPLYGSIVVQNGYIDLSALVGCPLAVINLAGYTSAVIRNVHFKGGTNGLMPSTTTPSGVSLVNCRYARIEDCTAVDVRFATGAAFGIQVAEMAIISRIFIDGDTFGCICSGCDFDTQTDIRYRGRYKVLASGNSIRAVKSSSCRHSTYENLYATDCETVLEIFNCARINSKNVNGVNIGLKTYAGQTAVTYAATLPDGFMQYALFDGINLDNIGGHGFQASGDSQGRIQVSNIGVINAVGAPVIIATSNTTIRGAILENWNTGAVAGMAAIVSSAVSPTAAIYIDGLIAIHTDNTKPVMNLAAGPAYYNVLHAVSPSGNPLYDTTNGISLGSGNAFSDAVAGTIRSGTVTRIGHIGNVATFSVPNTKTFTFTTATFSKCFVIEDGTGGQSALVFADQASATITLVSNPSAIFVASAAPGAGTIGIFKSAGSDIVSVKNNVGSTITLGVCVIGDKVIFTTDPA